MKREWAARIDGRGMDNDEIISAICENRGIDDLAEFLKPTEDYLIPYEKLININQAWYELSVALDNGKMIHVLADCDTDGCTAGAIMYRYLKNFTNNITIDINEGKEHGVENMDVTNCKADLIIIVDSINKAEAYDKFIENGKDVIVLDHHIPPSQIDEYNNITLVSSANAYPNPQLSGAGVVWKFCKYCDNMWLTDYADILVDLAACGIIADMCDVSITENRYICYVGLKNLSNIGVKSIVGSYVFDSQAVTFSVATLVNACNRMNRNELALQIFLVDDELKAKSIVKEMKKVKDKQNELVTELMPALIKSAQTQLENKVMSFTIDTEYGVSGLIANKLMERYQRPILVLKYSDGQYAGSMRACGVDDFAAIVNSTGLADCEGHELAAGIFINEDNYHEFMCKVNNMLANIDFEERIVADIQLDIAQINTQLISNFKTINFISGTGFAPLRVMITGIRDYEVSSMSNGKHLKLITDNGLIIKWNFVGNFEAFKGTVDIIATLNSGYFGKVFYNQIIIDEYRIN